MIFVFTSLDKDLPPGRRQTITQAITDVSSTGIFVKTSKVSEDKNISFHTKAFENAYQDFNHCWDNN